ncbi:amidohydrolase family protein [Absiella sp. AM54-8XD]|nr:amidohydrolase family protein [Absiella sp. AM54-8XD]
MLLKDIAYLNESMEVVYHQDIRIEGAYIKEIKAHGTLHPVENEEWMDGSSLLMMPGLCDAHMHTGQQLLKGRILDAQGMIWKEIMLPFESTLTKDIMRINAQLAALEMIKGGTTSFVEAGSYFMEEAASVYVQSGLRGLLTYSTMDDDPALPDQIQDTWDSA